MQYKIVAKTCEVEPFTTICACNEYAFERQLKRKESDGFICVAKLYSPMNNFYTATLVKESGLK